MSWRPLLEGELAARAEEALHAISEELPEPSFPSIGGKADVALFHAYFGNIDCAEALLDRAVDALASTPMPPALYGGFTGIAWVAEHVSRMAGEAEDDDVYEEIDRGVLAAIAEPANADYDLINGLTGLGVYALSRVPRPLAVRCVAGIVDRLYEMAEIHEHGITWFTAPELLYPHQRQRYPRGGYNLGVAHGVAGVIAFLGEACRLGIRLETARPLLDGAVRWLLSCRLSEQRGASFAAWLLPGVDAQPSRLAWCYGAPGVAAALLSAARAAGNEAWERVALDIALRAATAHPDEAGVQDAGLCHGALGLAHLYNRIYQTAGGDAFAEAARDWYRRGLDLRQPGRGIAGFESWEFGADLQLGWRTDPSFLTGAAGVGLALLAAVTPVEPEWDRLLMLPRGLRE